MPTTRVELLVRPSLNFALLQAGVPIVQAARIENAGETRLEGATLVLQLEPDIGQPVVRAIETLHPGESVNLEAFDLRVPADRLRTIVEAERAELTWELRRGDEILAAGAQPIEVLAWNEWPGETAPPALLAVFVTPNHAALVPVLKAVSERLRVTTGVPAITGYQTGSPERVLAQVHALYETLQQRGLAYVGVPASFEQQGQKVRLPDVLLQDQLGNCLDVSLLFASCLEQMGLHPLVVTIPGHAFPGVWLVEDRFPEVVVHDPARLRTAIGLDQLVFWDSSTSIASPSVPFEGARQVAHRMLADDRLRWALDVKMARAERWRPLPVRNAVAVEAEEAMPLANVAVMLDEDDVVLEPEFVPEGRAPSEPVRARFARWKDRLLDLSLRNKLLAFRTDVKTAIPLDIPDINRFEDKLAADTVFDLRPRPPKDARDERDAALIEVRADPADQRAQRLADLERGILQVDLSEADLVSHAVALERACHTDLEEGGANTLFAAVGFLKWFEASQAGMPRLAPLLLVPVALEVNRTSRRVRVRRMPEDAVANHTLIEKLRRDFALDLSPLANPDADESGVDVPGLLRAARTAIARMDRWEVREQVALGQFVFGKFLLWKDLADNAEALLQNPVVQHIATRSDRAYPNPVEATRPDELDDRVAPADLPLPIDADSTQMAAIHSALRGRSFVLQGPPGTGKSQTITNLIAAALAHGKTVLFVAEKRAALEVVHRRLQQCGLEDFCLELHSNKANKKEVITSLARSLERADRLVAPAWDVGSRKLQDSRTELNDHIRVLHKLHPVELSFYQASAQVLKLKKRADRLPLALPDVRRMSGADLQRRMDVTARFATAAANVEPTGAHPWRAAELVGWSAALEAEVAALLSTLRDQHRVVGERCAELAAGLSLAPPVDPGRARQLAAFGARLGEAPAPMVQAATAEWNRWVDEAMSHADALDAQRDRRAEVATRWTDEVYQADLGRLEPLFRTWTARFWLFSLIGLFFSRRELAPLARGNFASTRIRDDLGLAKAANEAAGPLDQKTRSLLRLTGESWDGSDGEGLRALVERGERLRKHAVRLGLEPAAVCLRLADPDLAGAARRRVADLAAAADQALTEWQRTWQKLAEVLHTAPADDEPFSGSAERAGAWTASLSKLRYWGMYLERVAEMQAAGLGPVAQAHREGRVAAAGVVDVARHSLLGPWVDAVRDAEPVLRAFEGKEHHRRVEQFRKLDRQHQRLSAETVVHRLEQRLPNPGAAPESSEPGMLLREAKKKTRQKPIRRLLQDIPNLLPRLKPCLLMSPLSVAQYLPAAGKRFDVVVFDEASQIGTHDAIGALARGNQVIVVGDSRQLPPTAFFTRASDDGGGDENDFEELESILDEAEASGLPQQLLGWHYRSRHESLIQFSNAHFYENRLNVFPAARGKVEDLGVSWHPVQGTFGRGSTRNNQREAEELVAFLVESLRSAVPGQRTFGVVTFSQAQQTLVNDLIDDQRRLHPEIEGHFAGISEPVFVKNLENVQGDERDEILFSIAYGPDDSGKVAMNFGPLNREGGERRLNVAVTRARQKLRVFSSLSADQIDLNRTKATGARRLKEFLQYAQAQGTRSAEGTNTEGEFDSDFEREVHDVLVSSGYRVHCQVGCRGYRIDLAVAHPDKPGEYVLAVECDGAAYHSAATARDRDRLRQQVLEGLGWTVHRIWSTDWWFERQREIDRLLKAVSTAIESARTAPPPKPPEKAAEPAAPVRIQAAAPVVAPPADPYQVARIEPVSADPESMYERRYEQVLRRVIAEVVRVEAPLHVDVLARRVVAAFGGMKATARVRAQVMRVATGISVHGEFVWPAGVEPSAWTRVRDPGSEPRDADEIPPEELAAAAAQVLHACLSLPEEDLVRETARRVGIQRVGKKVAEAMVAAIELLLRRGGASRQGTQIVGIAR